jgi:hypothetical protein
VLSDRSEIQRLRRAQRAPESLSAIGELEARRVGVQIGTSARQPSTPVDDQLTVNRYDP